MARAEELTICFADICQSTSLFEEHGDERAREIVSQALGLITDATEQRGGTVAKPLGDGLLIIFPEVAAAVRAAVEFPEVVRRDETLAALGMEISCGLCHGEVLREEGDVFGDAVNTAARLADWAHAGQVVTTAETMGALPDSTNAFARSLGEKVLRGKDQAVEIIELIGEERGSKLTIVEDQEVPASIGNPEALLLLRHGEKTYRIGQDPFWVGRGAVNDLQVRGPRVSRKHGFIELQGGSFVYTDRSTNGTYVQVGTEDVTFVHHDQLRLHGSGQISLGRPLGAGDAATGDADPLRFECRQNVSGAPSGERSSGEMG